MPVLPEKTLLRELRRKPALREAPIAHVPQKHLRMPRLERMRIEEALLEQTEVPSVQDGLGRATSSARVRLAGEREHVAVRPRRAAAGAALHELALPIRLADRAALVATLPIGALARILATPLRDLHSARGHRSAANSEISANESLAVAKLHAPAPPACLKLSSLDRVSKPDPISSSRAVGIPSAFAGSIASCTHRRIEV